MNDNKKWTNQELFDFCKKEFLSPEFKQCLSDDEDSCVYYNPVDNDNRCIMGKTMSLEYAKNLAASKEYRRYPISFLMVKKHPAVDHLSDISCNLATSLQMVHDRFEIIGRAVEDDLRDIAKTFGLQYEH